MKTKNKPQVNNGEKPPINHKVPYYLSKESLSKTINHTQLPWTATDANSEYYIDIDSIDGRICSLNKSQDERGDDITDEEMTANGKFIAKACNSHYDLLNALKDASATLTRWQELEGGKYWDERDQETLDNIDKVIKETEN